LVHHQLSDFLTLGPEEFARRHPHRHPWIERVATQLIDHELFPLASELAVSDVEMGVAFRLDLVCVRPSGKIVFVELKNAGSRDLFFLAEPADPELPELGLQRLVRGRCPDSDYTRAVLEVGVGAYMAVRCLKLNCDFDVAIMLVTPATVEFIPVPAVDEEKVKQKKQHLAMDMAHLIVDVYADMLLEVPLRQAEALARRTKKKVGPAAVAAAAAALAEDASQSSSSGSADGSSSVNVDIGDDF
jgi:hypothetical protein